MKSRRRFLAAMAAGACSITLPASAQSSIHRVAWLSPTRAADGSVFFNELRRGLNELGYAEGKNLRVEPYWGEDSAERVDKLIAEAVASSPSVIVMQGATAVRTSRATSTIPLVFGYSGDPVDAGMVDTLSRPGRNATGISYLVLELVGKRMELLKETLPNVKSVAVIASPQHPGDKVERQVSQRAATALGLSVEYFEASNPALLIEALAAIEKAGRSQAVMLFPVQYVISQRERIAAWSMKTRIPTMSGWAQFAEGGNFMSYGPNLREASRRMAFFVDRVLKGSRPADLPVELPTRVELVVNQKAAKALGIRVPQAVLLRADRVIE